jgi:hypothetical protein
MAKDDYAELLEAIREWPPAKRLALAEDLIRSVRERSAVTRRSTLERAAGLLSTGEAPPDDAECGRIVNAARDDKYDA